MTETPGSPGSAGSSTAPPQDPPLPPGSSAGPARSDRLRNYEQLRRTVADRKIAGVAGGLGRHLAVDPTIVRVLLVVLCFFGGAGFLIYGVAWLLVPEEGREDAAITLAPATRNVLLIVAFAVAALLLLGDSVNGTSFPWPLVAVVLVVTLIVVTARDRDRPGSVAPQGEPPPWLPANQAGEVPGTDPWTQRPRRLRRTGPLLLGPTVALVAVAWGALGLYDAAGGSVVGSAYPAAALGVIGLMLVLGAFVGRAGGLILLGLVSTVVLEMTAVAASSGGADQLGNGDRVNVVPTTAAALNGSYFVPTGRLRVDLSHLSDPTALDGRRLSLTGRAGEIVLILPPEVRTTVTAGIDGPGAVDLPGRTEGGLGTQVRQTFGPPGAGGRVRVDTHLFAGHIDVRKAR